MALRLAFKRKFDKGQWTDAADAREAIGKAFQEVLPNQPFELPATLGDDGLFEPADPDASFRFQASVGVADIDAAEDLIKDVRSKHGDNVEIGADPSFSLHDLYLPNTPASLLFGNSRMAHALIGIDRVDPGWGQGVNVVVVDGGFDGRWLSSVQGKGPGEGKKLDGWGRYETLRTGDRQRYQPGESRAETPSDAATQHARMIVRNILAIAPAARIWDVPLLPAQAQDPPMASVAEAILYYFRRDHRRKRKGSVDLPDGPWVLVNAWGVSNPSIYERLADRNIGYADNPDHFLINDMPKLADQGIDVVFAAGNCGEPCPQRKCGADDCGPGRSIHGLNAHPSVLTVGAVTVDGRPIGLSAQGPGRLAKNWVASKSAEKWRVKDTRLKDNTLATEKPDLCAPSHFGDSDDMRSANTGTSAAAGVAAGIIAALRSISDYKSLPPSDIRHALRQGAKDASGTKEWDARLGYGVINVPATIRALKDLPKPPPAAA
jgi:subtilisin family serine protease